jgi:hypothetical protein
MVPLAAEILTEQLIGDPRTAVRRSLRVGVQAHASGDVAMAMILNISETGLLLETGVRLAVGETLQVELPEASASTVRVVWTEGLLAGCEFAHPISQGTISAAQLKSPVDEAEPASEVPRATESSFESDHPDFHETSIQTAVAVVIYLISLFAVVIFLAAIVPLR